MASLTAYSTTADGLVRNNGSSSWATLRNATDGTAAYNAQTAAASLCLADGTTADKYIDRSFYYFDLSSIPQNATITSATLSLYVSAASSAAGGSVTVVEGTQAATLTTADFDQVGSTEFVDSRTNFSALTATAYNNFTLNAAGLTYVQGKFASTAKLALRSSFDLDNSAPGTTVYSSMSGYFSDHTGTTEDPILTVVYTPVARTTSDSWAWSDSNSLAGSGGTTFAFPRTTSDAWAWTDTNTVYRRARTDVLVRDVGPQTQVATSTYTGGATLTVSSTTGFASSGTAYVQTSDFLSQGRVVYTGKTSTTFTGCTFTLLRGSASFPTGVLGMVMARDTTNHFPRVTKLDTTDTPPLLVSWTQHGSHGMLDGCIAFKITYDGGITFGSEQYVVTSPANGDGWGIYGHTMSRLKNGRLFCMWYEHKYDYLVADSIANFWTMASYSDNNGTSWSTPVEYATPFTYGSRAGSIGFASEVYTGSGSNSTYGDIYIPVFGNDDGIQVHSTGEPFRWYSKLMKITDGGAGGTWTEVGTMATTAQVGGRAVGEPGIAFLADGTWITHLRVENLSTGETSPYYPYYQRWQAVSSDKGVTWTGHTRVAPLGNGGVVFEIPGGTLLSSGQDIGRASGCTDYISYDQGTTWAFNRVETTDATYAYYAGSDAELIINDATVSRNTAFTWGDEKSTQTGARVQYRWFFDPSRTFDTWAWTDTATRTPYSFSKTTSDTWAWSDTAVGSGASYLSRTTSDTLAWSDTATSTTTHARTTSDTWAWTDTGILPSASFYSRTTTDTWTWTDTSGTQPATIHWLRARRRSSMSLPTKTYVQVQAKGTTKTATWTSPTYEAKTEAGILVVLDVTAASGTGGLTLRINAHDQASSQAVALNAAPTAVTGTGTTSYALYPFGAVAGNVTQATSFYLPRMFSITVTHGDSSSYTYSVGYCLLP